ncbi:MAG TPA: hypothetical protein VFE25_04730 [Opitutaceae bacterium]|nr:hypothetical protein [Opitutaceae bacterium]
MVKPSPHSSWPAPSRSSVIVMVLVTLLFTTVALVAFIEKAGVELMVDVRTSEAKRLRVEAFSALEVTLSVLEDFREADNGLHSPAEGWNDPLAWADWSPSEGRMVEVSFQDESGKIPLSHIDVTTLTNLFLYWQMPTADAAKLADAINGWMKQGYVYSSALTPDYQDATPAYAEPGRPMRAFSELSAIAYAKDIFFDENGLPTANYWRFVNDVSLFNYPQPNANGATPDVLAAVGQYTDSQMQHLTDYTAGKGQFAQEGQQWFKDTTTLGAIAGAGGNATLFGTTITALRVNITVHEGHSTYRLSAVVAPQGGATMNQTNAVNATAAASSASTTASTSVTATAQPSTTASTSAAAAAAAQSINYPFTLLQVLEDDEIPQPPPAPPST